LILGIFQIHSEVWAKQGVGALPRLHNRLLFLAGVLLGLSLRKNLPPMLTNSYR